MASLWITRQKFCMHFSSRHAYYRFRSSWPPLLMTLLPYNNYLHAASPSWKIMRPLGFCMGKGILTKCLHFFTDKASHNLSLSRVTTTISQLLTFWYPQWDSPRSKSWWRATGWWNGKSPLGPFHRQDYIDQNTASSTHVTKQRQAPHRAWYPHPPSLFGNDSGKFNSCSQRN